MKTFPTFGTGAIQSPEDYRDIPLAALSSDIATAKPTSAFIDVTMLPHWNQRKIGACVGHAGAKYKQRVDYAEGQQVYPLSARFLYALAKCRDGFAGEGTYPRLVAKILKDHGCATEATIPNDTTLSHEDYVYNRVEANIPKAAFDEAGPFRISGYAFPNVQSIDDLKSAVLNFNGAMLLMKTGKEWFTAPDGTITWDEKLLLPIRHPDPQTSAHEVYLYGYEDVVENGVTRTKFYVFNSWTDEWAQAGNGWFYHDEYAPWLAEAITFVDLPNNWTDLAHSLPSKETFSHYFQFNLSQGQTSSEVTALQTALMIDGDFDKTLYASLLKNNTLGYYGSITSKAVLAYQLKYNVASLTELNSLGGRSVGPKTRLHLNSWTNK